MASITDLRYEKNGCVHAPASGFAVTASGMQVTIGAGGMHGVGYAEDSFTVATPSAGVEQWTVYAMQDGSLVDHYGDGRASGAVADGIAWTQVPHDATTLESNSFIRRLPLN